MILLQKMQVFTFTTISVKGVFRIFLIVISSVLSRYEGMTKFFTGAQRDPDVRYRLIARDAVARIAENSKIQGGTSGSLDDGTKCRYIPF